MKFWLGRLIDVKVMCETDFNGYWSLKFLPYSGGFYNQPADELEDIITMISAVNTRIAEKQEVK